MTDLPPLPPLPAEQPSSPREWLSERIILIFVICVGYVALLVLYTHSGSKLDPSIQNVLSTGLGTLGAAVGVIVAAVFKSDKTDRQNADTLAKMAQSTSIGDGK